MYHNKGHRSTLVNRATAQTKSQKILKANYFAVATLNHSLSASTVMSSACRDSCTSLELHKRPHLACASISVQMVPGDSVSSLARHNAAVVKLSVDGHIALSCVYLERSPDGHTFVQSRRPGTELCSARTCAHVTQVHTDAKPRIRGDPSINVDSPEHGQSVKRHVLCCVAIPG